MRTELNALHRFRASRLICSDPLLRSDRIRWPPHINILFPFVAVDDFDATAKALEAALADVPAFAVRMRTCRTFQHSKNSVTAWFDPECRDDEAWSSLEAACRAALGDDDDGADRGARREFTPHLTIGQFSNATSAASLVATVATNFEPIEFTVGEVRKRVTHGSDISDDLLTRWSESRPVPFRSFSLRAMVPTRRS